MTVLSIQSSVAVGHVGNAAAVFGLRRLGIDVWPVDTVSFSNHPGHGQWRGRVVEAAEVSELIEGIRVRGFFPECRAVLGGYLGRAETGRVVVEAVRAVKAANADAVFACDPVMGDAAEGLYVGADVAAVIGDALVPVADLLFPNAFELAHLSGRAVGNAADALTAADAVGSPITVVTSLEPGRTISTMAVTPTEAWQVTTPRLSTPAKGAGDLFAALFLGRYLATRSVPEALAGAVASVFAVMDVTCRARVPEMCLVAAQDALVDPPELFPVETVR
jgi:pyridoxine kinase